MKKTILLLIIVSLGLSTTGVLLKGSGGIFLTLFGGILAMITLVMALNREKKADRRRS